MIDAEMAVVLVTEEDRVGIVGFLGAICHQAFFQPSCRIAQEMAWFVTSSARAGRHGQALFQAFEAWGKAMGAQVLVMASLQTSAAHVAEYLQFQGYTPAETMYSRTVGEG